MTDTEERSAQDRWDTIKALWKRDQWLYIVAGFLAGLLVSPLVQSIQSDGGEFARSLVPEAIGIGFTVLLLDRIYRRREDQRTERELKERLIRELSSSVNEVAKRAAEELRAHGWLVDGSLRGAELWEADLRGVNFHSADLQGCTFMSTNLRGVDFCFANLREVDLSDADLLGAALIAADLRGAKSFQTNLPEVTLRLANLQSSIMRCANLRGADLRQTNLQGADMQWADLQGVDLASCKMDTTTILPDGSNWSVETEMSRFTDSTHPRFWRSDDPDSPAHPETSALLAKLNAERASLSRQG